MTMTTDAPAATGGKRNGEADLRARVRDASPARGEPPGGGPAAGSASASTFLRALTDGDTWRARVERAKQADLVQGRPASLGAVVAHTRTGGWIPGDHPWWVEAPGYVYGWAVAIPVTAGLYAAAWVLQRPTRLAVFLIVAGLLWLAW